LRIASRMSVRASWRIARILFAMIREQAAELHFLCRGGGIEPTTSSCRKGCEAAVRGIGRHRGHLPLEQTSVES
jgi:hypothetical protein